ncbi:hypothetical protein B6N60_04083 [Richelia sinica FACHB-800]|uniref:Uncharacterized protein n=1 Tax=Richelia sinica FACHB-800 TaxID=1357546 RepID=A0A975TAZ8_9NOST|nr:hypothetical protein B6N60_04083 [Richelia sinica FACHB-800]
MTPPLTPSRKRGGEQEKIEKVASFHPVRGDKKKIVAPSP